MKIAKIEKVLDKMVKEEIGPDGYVRVDKVEICPDGNLIKISGAWGECNSQEADGNWQYEYVLEYADGKSLEFIKGMFYRELEKLF